MTSRLTAKAHQLTTELARTYGQVVIEDLDIAAMKRWGRRPGPPHQREPGERT
jgi:hypothetical protein